MCVCIFDYIYIYEYICVYAEVQHREFRIIIIEYWIELLELRWRRDDLQTEYVMCIVPVTTPLCVLSLYLSLSCSYFTYIRCGSKCAFNEVFLWRRDWICTQSLCLSAHRLNYVGRFLCVFHAALRERLLVRSSMMMCDWIAVLYNQLWLVLGASKQVAARFGKCKIDWKSYSDRVFGKKSQRNGYSVGMYNCW